MHSFHLPAPLPARGAEELGSQGSFRSENLKSSHSGHVSSQASFWPPLIPPQSHHASFHPAHGLCGFLSRRPCETESPRVTFSKMFYSLHPSSPFATCLAVHLPPFPPIFVQVRVSMAVNRHHDHDSSYKGNHLIGAHLQFWRFSPLSSWCDMVACRQTWCWRGL